MIFIRFILILIVFSLPLTAKAQEIPTVIRDTEIENTIKTWASPILEAANLGPQSVNIVIVQSPQMNAFVAGGANVFLFTGLIEQTENPGELIGVFAHELGHVAGGHLISSKTALERASYESILGTLLGIGAAIATGDSQAALAITSGTSNMAARRFLAHTRVHESSADQAALRYMETAKVNPGGLVSFLEKLKSEELLPRSKQSEYVRTHPLTENRIRDLRNSAQSSPYKNKPFPEEWEKQHARMIAKLIGFISPGHVPWEYDDRDNSIPARYARTIAAYQQNNVEEALAGINSLLAEEPKNPYFHELKGQMLLDFGRVEKAIPAYRKAVSILPDAPLIQIALAHALIESGSEENIHEALKHLEAALVHEPRSTRAQRLAGTAYGKLGQEAKAKLYLAEEAVLQQRFDYAKRLAVSAAQTLPEGSRDWIKARDILSFLENQKG